MSQIDNCAKHALQNIILHDCNVSILPQGLAGIAAYTMKSAFIGDSITRHRESFFDQQNRQDFARSRRPLEEAHMWLGRIQQPQGKKQGVYKTRYGSGAAQKTLDNIADRARVLQLIPEDRRRGVSRCRWTKFRLG
jgi:hypothetical protein